MLVYVLNKDGKPLMPCKPQKARRLLEAGKATVVKRTPFTIKLKYGSSGYKQDVTLGVDAGSKHIGLSACTEEKELYAAEVECRSDITRLLSQRRELRRARRSRKRYREPRFNNRGKKGWFAPSVRHKIDTHLKVIEEVHKLLPVTKVIIETAAFDTQKLKNPEIEGTDYQKGEQLGFWNVREYVLFRDNHTCQHCKGKNKVLNVHHIESRKTGGNSPSNLITLCEECHKAFHNGEIKLKVKRRESFRDAAFMGIMRWTVYNELKELYPDVKMTFGYITKNTRIKHGLPKSHIVDARCISGNPLAKPLDEYFYIKKVRCHNRQIHKLTINKGGYRKRNQADYKVKGFRLFDTVSCDGKEYFVHGRRLKGSFVLTTLAGDKIEKAPSKLKFVNTNRGYLTERKKALLPAL